MITMGAQIGQAQSVELWGQITLADGTKLAPRLFDRGETVGHKVKRWCRGALRGIGLALILAAAMGRVDPLVAAPAATVITNAGQAIDTNLISGLGGTVPKYIAWGTGAGTAAAADTTLFTESTEESRTTGTPTRVTTTVTNDTVQIAGTITVATSNKTITNVGIFDASTSGNLWFKSDFTGLALLIGDAIAWTLKVKFT